MRILPFRRPDMPNFTPLHDDWTQQDLADFYRAHRLLLQNGVAIGMDRGQSDLGDPWMVLYDQGSQDVFLHVARFEDRCVLICDQFDLHVTGATVRELIETFESEILRYVSQTREKHGNVLQHPASRLIMSISALFLLFKLENGEAQAKVLPAETPDQTAARKEISSATAARATPVIARIFDIADAPAAAAAIAGAILSVELGRLLLTDEGASDLLSSTRMTPSDLVLQTQAHAEVSPAPFADPLIAEIQMAQNPVPAQVVLPEAPEPALLAFAQPTVMEQDIPTGAGTLLDTSPVRPLPAGSSPKAAPDPIPHEPSREVAPEIAAPADSQAVQLVQPLLASLGDESLFHLSLADLPVTTADVTLGPEVLGDISVADLGRLDGLVSATFESELTGDALTEKIIEFINLFDDYEVEIAGQTVLIEQHDAAALQADQIGIWTNLMPDGSAITVVGQHALLSSALHVLA